MILNGSWTTARVGLKWPLDVQETKSMVTKLAILCFLFDHYKVDCQWILLPCNRSSTIFFPFTEFNFEPSSRQLPLFHRGRNLDLRTSMLEDRALQWKYHSRITTVYSWSIEFPQITLCSAVNSRITQNPFHTLIQWCQFKTARIPFATI